MPFNNKSGIILFSPGQPFLLMYNSCFTFAHFPLSVVIMKSSSSSSLPLTSWLYLDSPYTYMGTVFSRSTRPMFSYVSGKSISGTVSRALHSSRLFAFCSRYLIWGSFSGRKEAAKHCKRQQPSLPEGLITSRASLHDNGLYIAAPETAVTNPS